MTHNELVDNTPLRWDGPEVCSAHFPEVSSGNEPQLPKVVPRLLAHPELASRPSLAHDPIPPAVPSGDHLPYTRLKVVSASQGQFLGNPSSGSLVQSICLKKKTFCLKAWRATASGSVKMWNMVHLWGVGYPSSVRLMSSPDSGPILSCSWFPNIKEPSLWPPGVAVSDPQK